MKYRMAFFIFNAIALLTFIIIIALPVLVLGWDNTSAFWQRSWPIPTFFLLFLIILDGYFIRNWKFFHQMETKDWPNLQTYLKNQLVEKKRLDYPRLLILLNTYLIQGNVDGIYHLGNLVKSGQPKLFRRAMAPLSCAHLLKKDYEGLTDLLQDELSDDSVTRDGWGDWLWAFAMLRKKEMRLAGRRLILLSLKGKNEMVRLLALYVLIDILDFDMPEEPCKDFLMKFRKKYSPASWEKKVNKKKDQLHILLLCDFIQEAGEWCIKDYQPTPPIASASPENLEDYVPNPFDGDEHE